MKSKSPLFTENHKDHFIYENTPFFSPEHGELNTIEWATVIDISLIEPSTFDPEDYFSRPSYYLQITPNGHIRGVTHDCDEHSDYFSVAAEKSDVKFLKLFIEQYPHVTPMLSSLLYYRKDQASKLEAYLSDLKNLES